uniref:Peptidase metallopeptidase domain-containing protein n=1 Tax=Setaria digitata TaxID=48799 RepID=A0A915PSL1_9BILA
MKQTNGIIPVMSVKNAAQYLIDYGYLQSTSFPFMLNTHSDTPNLLQNSTTMSDALKRFQKFSGLEVTGKLDEATRKKMQQKRCGRLDVTSLRRHGEYKWKKNDLTYSIESLPNEPSEHEVREALRKASDMWTKVTPLTLNEVSHKADIEIAFAQRMHNDPWPFDGQGGVLAHATLPTSGILHFDSEEKWVYMNPQAISGADDTTDLLQVAVHETGHVLGLEHSADSNSIMTPFYRESVDHRGNYVMPKLSASDVKNIQHLYGLNLGKTSSRSKTTGTDLRLSGNNLEYSPVYGNDSLNGRDRERKVDSSCPDEVDGIIMVNGSNYLFSGATVYEFDQTGIKKEYQLNELFPNGPPFVQGALSNPRTLRTLLFHGKLVFAYRPQRNKSNFALEADYPKRLPATLNFKPMGAFMWIEGSQGNHFATYDENWNYVTLQNEVINYFDNFPAKPIRGTIASLCKNLLLGYEGEEKIKIGCAHSAKRRSVVW